MESDISLPDFRAIFEAHKVNGAMLCPSSVYCDIAITLGNYLHKFNPIKANRSVEVANMATTKPLLMQTPGNSELFRTSVEADWASQTATVNFYSLGSSGEKAVEYATCMLRFGDSDYWVSEWRRIAHLVQSRMKTLRDAAHNGSCHLIKRGMAYKLFENCVEYGQSFQGIDEVYLDSKDHEATARVTFKDKSTCFHANPYYIDSLGHLSGFIMNATESFDYKSHVFLNHGWESIRCAAKLSAEGTYDTYVKMKSLDGKRYVGDVYIFQGDSIVGVNQGVAFQAVPRKVLDILLPNPSKDAKMDTAKETTTVASRRAGAPQKDIGRPENAQMSRNEQTLVFPQKDQVPETFLLVRALNIIAEETGITIVELTNDLLFTDIGVDSLQALSICGRLREELNINVGSTLFLEYPTVGDLKIFLGAGTGLADAPEDNSKCSTPGLGFSRDGDFANTPSDATDVGQEDREREPMRGDNPFLSEVCTILAEELGVEVEDVWNAPSLTELGLDSLMSLSILGRLREQLNIDLPSELFSDDDMTTIRRKLLNDSAGSNNPNPIPTTPTSIVCTSIPTTIPTATSVLLQGNLATAQKVLFLFPDGSGSATSYAALPPVAPRVAIVGLNCPYLKRPQDLKCALQDMTALYLAEIRRRQAYGPYYLGGWSAGGICAYDAAATLVEAGEQVASLILIDSPNPIRLEKLPIRMYHFLNDAGMFGSGGSKPIPEWLLPHFLAFIDALALYEPTPFTPGTAPKTHAIWASDGVYESTEGKRLEERPDDTREMKWLLNSRTDFGPNGWDSLVGMESLTTEVLHGANHFTMMEGRQGLKLSRFLARSMGI